MRSRLIKSLGSWHFEPLKLPEEEVLACTYILFESLFCKEGMQEDAGVSLCTLSRPRLICGVCMLNSPNPHQPKSPRSCNTCAKYTAVLTATTTFNTPWTFSRRHIFSCIRPVWSHQYRYYSPRARTGDHGNRTRTRNGHMLPHSPTWISLRFTSPLSAMTSDIQASPMPSW